MLKRVLAMLIRAVAGLIPFSSFPKHLQLMLRTVARGFSIGGVLGFLLRPVEVRLRRVLLRLHLADVAPRRVAGAGGTGIINSVAHCWFSSPGAACKIAISDMFIPLLNFALPDR